LNPPDFARSPKLKSSGWIIEAGMAGCADRAGNRGKFGDVGLPGLPKEAESDD
jgi:hypothetical protein